MKLRTGKPLWLARAPQPLRRRRLSSSVSCDVAVIGAGITGALVAHQLLAAGLSVVMIDKRRAGFGSTAASTGLLMIQPDTSIAELTKLHDQATAARVYALGRRAIGELATLVRKLEINCGWHSRQTLYVASSPSDVGRLTAEAKRTRQIGFPVQQLSAGTVRRRYRVDFPGALVASGAAEVSAVDLTRGVLAHAQKIPAFQLYQGTRVTSLRENDAQVVLRIHGGHRVQARHAIVAAGYESRQFVRSKLIRLRSTYVIASKPFGSEDLRPVRCLMWETARPYFYLRTTADHRVIFGGSDEPFETDRSREGRLDQKTQELEEQFAALFPSLAFRADYAWSGTFAETTDGLPCIGSRTVGSRVLYALGYGGNGITFSQIAAKLLRDVCVGKANSDLSLFAFDRVVHARSRPQK